MTGFQVRLGRILSFLRTVHLVLHGKGFQEIRVRAATALQPHRTLEQRMQRLLSFPSRLWVLYHRSCKQGMVRKKIESARR